MFFFAMTFRCNSLKNGLEKCCLMTSFQDPIYFNGSFTETIHYCSSISKSIPMKCKICRDSLFIIPTWICITEEFPIPFYIINQPIT